MARIVLLSLMGLVLAQPALVQTAAAQSQPGIGPSLGYAPAGELPKAAWEQPSWEARLGAGVANPGGREGGLLNLGGEFVTPRAIQLQDRFAAAFVPRFHIGSSVNFNGTRYAYAGATWTIDLSQSVFVEASLGAALNDGKTGLVVPEDRLRVGCNTGARAAGGLGYRFNDRWSVSATLEHFTTTGCGDADKPRGPANFGARLGYSF